MLTEVLIFDRVGDAVRTQSVVAPVEPGVNRILVMDPYYIRACFLCARFEQLNDV